jgi:hypothetical protein
LRQDLVHHFLCADSLYEPRRRFCCSRHPAGPVPLSAPGKWIRFVRRISAHPDELVLEITEHPAGDWTFERRLGLKKI